MKQQAGAELCQAQIKLGLTYLPYLMLSFLYLQSNMVVFLLSKT